MKYLLIGLSLLSISCTTIATRTNGETLKIRGSGKASWADGTSIEGKPVVEMPKLPPISWEQ